MTAIDPRFDHRELLEEVARRAADFLAELPDRPVPADPRAVAGLAAWRGRPLPAGPSDPAETVREIDEAMRAATVASAGPRYFGFVHGGSLPAALATSWLAAAWDQNAFAYRSAPGAVHVEEVALAWCREILGLPAEAAATLTTGASVANFTALAAARHRVLARAGHDVERHGLFGAPAITVALSAESHPTVRKALGLLGLGRERVLELAVDAQGRIDAARLPAEVRGPLIVCAQAGNVNSGASDPFDALREWTSARAGWLHVDGAFGLWAQASPALRGQTRGVERADSWATDGHKWLNVPYDCGLAFVRDADALRAAMAFDAAYLPAAGEDVPREPYHYGVEASRRARGLEVFAALRSLGRQGVSDMVERCCAHARRFADGLRGAGCEVLNEVVLNQVVVAFGDARSTAEVIARVQAAGVCWCGPTHWRGRDAMRISVSCWATEEDDVERALDSILVCAGRRRARPPASVGSGAGSALGQGGIARAEGAS